MPKAGLSPARWWKETFELIERIVAAPVPLQDRDAIRRHFTELTGHLKNLPYSPPGSPDDQRFRAEIDAMLAGSP